MCSLSKLERITDEVDAGLAKLDKGDIWTANSSPVSLFIVSQLLLWTSIVGFCLDTYYYLKKKLYWEPNFKKLWK